MQIVGLHESVRNLDEIFGELSLFLQMASITKSTFFTSSKHEKAGIYDKIAWYLEPGWKHMFMYSVGLYMYCTCRKNKHSETPKYFVVGVKLC